MGLADMPPDRHAGSFVWPAAFGDDLKHRHASQFGDHAGTEARAFGVVVPPWACIARGVRPAEYVYEQGVEVELAEVLLECLEIDGHGKLMLISAGEAVLISREVQ